MQLQCGLIQRGLEVDKGINLSQSTGYKKDPNWKFIM